MKKLIILFLLLSASIAGYSQNGFSGVFLRVQDSAAYVNSSNTIAKHTGGYADIWYSDASNLFWKWNGSSYEAFGASSIDGKPAATTYSGSHTLSLSDINTFNGFGVMRFTNSSPANITVPLNASVNFPVKTQIAIDNQGSDTLTVVWTGGVTGNDGGYVEIFPGGFAVLYQPIINEWDLSGTQPGGGSGVSTFVSLTDGPGAFSGNTLSYARVNTGGTALEYRTPTQVRSDIGAQATITPAALTKTDDTNVTLTLGGTPSTALLQASSLTVGWTGTLAKSRGGTGNANGPAINYGFAFSDEVTPLIVSSQQYKDHMPYAMTITSVVCGLSVAQTSGSIFTVDIKKNGTTIFSTKPTIDNAEESTVTAATASVLSITTFAADDIITAYVQQVGDGTAKGIKCHIIGY